MRFPLKMPSVPVDATVTFWSPTGYSEEPRPDDLGEERRSTLPHGWSNARFNTFVDVNVGVFDSGLRCVQFPDDTSMRIYIRREHWPVFVIEKLPALIAAASQAAIAAALAPLISLNMDVAFKPDPVADALRALLGIPPPLVKEYDDDAAPSNDVASMEPEGRA